MNIYKSEECFHKCNQSLSKIFGVEYIPMIFENIIIESSIIEPWNKGKIMDDDYRESRRYKLNEEQYKRVIEHLKNIRCKIYTKERNENISKKLTGKSLSTERKRNISKSKKGNTLSEEHKKSISEGMKGKKNFSGKKHSEETKNKMSEAKRPPPWNKGLNGYKKTKSTT